SDRAPHPRHLGRRPGSEISSRQRQIDPLFFLIGVMRSFYSLEGVAKFSGLGAPTQTVRLYGKAAQQRQIDFAAASY
ncbi:MAG TPA: hypothetical protein VGN04_01165, partial [Herbaspirillum sp.]